MYILEKLLYIKMKKTSSSAHFINRMPQGVHGGAWKVAYADFVTAMMAFFLLMWLLNATTEEQRSGIADYFDPKIPISQSSAGGVGMFKGDSVFAQNKLARNGLGGSGSKAAKGTEEDQRQEVAKSEDVWRQGVIKDKNKGQEKSEDNLNIAQESESGKDGEAQKIENEIKRQLEQVAQGKNLAEQLNFKMTDEGLRIDITDNDGTSMFNSGSDRPTEKMKQIMSVVSSVISELENEIAITGHTDSTPFRSRRNFSNWELSSQRAHSARRMLIDSGFDNNRIKRIEGRADKEPYDGAQTDDPINRRIGIVLIRDTSLDAMRHEHLKNSNALDQSNILKDDDRGIGALGSDKRKIFIPKQNKFQ